MKKTHKMPAIDLKCLQSKRFLEQLGGAEESSHFRQWPPLESSGSVPGRKLQVVVCMLLVELCERFTFFATVCNMILFCTLKLGYDNYQSAIVNLCFVGASLLSPVLVGCCVESFLGRTKIIYICSFLHFLGSAMLPVVAFPFEDFYIDTHHIAHTLARREQTFFFYIGLLMAVLGSGGIRAIVCPLGAYSLQGHSRKELMAFFNWFHWLVNLNSLVVFVGIAYIQQSVAKNLGFLIPFMSVVMTLITIHMTRNNLIFQPRKGVSLQTTFIVFTNALKMCCVNHRYLGGRVTTWLDRAKENNGGQFSESLVESTKSLLRLLPFYTLQILYRVGVTQISSGYFIQSMNSNLSLNGFLLPIAAMKIISILPLLVAAPCIEFINTYVPGHGLSPVTSIICGHLCAALSLLLAGVYEIYRKSFPLVEQTLSGQVLLVSSMPCLQLAPQYALLGLAELLVAPSCSVLSFTLVPGRIRGISMHFLALCNAISCFLGAFMVEVLFLGSEGDWYPSFLASGHMERFFFFLASAMLLNTVGFWRISRRCIDLDQENEQLFKGSFLEEKLLQHEKSLRFYESIIERRPPSSPVETAF